MAGHRDNLFDDIFEVKERDPDGRFFDRVSRFRCKSDLYEADLLIDINIDLYPLEVGERLKLLLTTSLALDGSKTSENYDADVCSGRVPSKMDDYDYVVHGKVYKFLDDADSGPTRVSVFVSFGGLLMKLSADAHNLRGIEVDNNLFLLIRKVL